MLKIRRLPDILVNQIAAGEVVERPASVVKELIENALDAGATRIDVTLEDAGRTLIKVTDNGCGMASDDLKLCVERHATSKLQNDHLDSIQTLGFRGEALPSIASVSYVKIMSRQHGDDHGWCLEVDHGMLSDLKPIALNEGTSVEVHRLFERVPARLKFLKAERTERAWVVDVIERLSLAYPHVHWTLTEGDRKTLDLPGSRTHDDEDRSFLTRFVSIVTPEDPSYLMPLKFHDPETNMGAHGFAGLPTYHKPQNQHIYTYVNGRSVRDKMLMQAIRAAYQDVLSHDRYPVILLRLQVPYTCVDVNVHPSKTEVRFQNNQDVRRVVVRAIRQALEREGQRSAGVAQTHTASPPSSAPGPLSHQPTFSSTPMVRDTLNPYQAPRFSSKTWGGPPQDSQLKMTLFHPSSEDASTSKQDISSIHRPLGEARMQLYQTYIVAETEEGLILVDQHAAHERIVYEQLKNNHIPGRQTLMIPAVVELRPLAYDALMIFQHQCIERGLIFESFGPATVLVRELPSVLAGCDPITLIQELADHALAHQGVESMDQQINHLYATMACHHSLRAGRSLNLEEMNALLRQMEDTLMTGQCNHGRPTYVRWTRQEIEKNFGRR